MNLKKAKQVRRELFKMGVVHEPMKRKLGGELWSPYRRAKNKLIREKYLTK